MTLLLKAAPECRLSEHYEPRIKCASHLGVGLESEQLERIIPQIVHKLSYHNFDAIACRGLSGLLVAPIIAREMKKTLLVVRNHLDCHSDRKVEGDYNARRYVILDDFVSMGTTCGKIVTAIAEAIPQARCIGICEYLRLYNQPIDLRDITPLLESIRGGIR